MGSFHQIGGIKQARNALHFAGSGLAIHQMIDSQQGMGLATTKGGLQLNNRVAALSGKALEHREHEQAHAFGNESALEKKHRIEVASGGLAFMHAADVCGELGLLKGAFQHIFMGNDHFTPRFKQGHCAHSKANFADAP